MRITRFAAVGCAAIFALSVTAAAQPPVRARDLGVPFDGTPGPLNAITDVPGIAVGHTTVIRDLPAKNGKPVAVRTGVTAILPRGPDSATVPVFGGWFSLNGNGEMTGTAWIDEGGFLEGPVLITNTHSVGTARDAAIKWLLAKNTSLSGAEAWWGLPVAAETWDGWLNDINGFHVTDQHVFGALDAASGGPVPEGSVGGGTGMICYEFKGGIGTSSRMVRIGDRSYTVGALLQANFGRRSQLTIAGAPVGREISDRAAYGDSGRPDSEQGSVIVVVGTDAPLLPHQLKRLARRVSLGLARTGAVSGNGSGDLFLAFSTANIGAWSPGATTQVEMLGNDQIDPVFTAVVEATEEAVVNALVAGRDMTGHQGRRVIALPHDRLRAVMKKYGR
jgi:L-aminopeptidase/D-esterase-like protein